MMVSMLTTTDNPHDPFDHYKEWYAFDTRMGYNSASLLGRIANLSHDLSDADYSLAIELAIDEVVKENVLGIFRKITRNVSEEEV